MRIRHTMQGGRCSQVWVWVYGRPDIHVWCFPQWLSILFIRPSLSLSLELTGSARLAGQ